MFIADSSVGIATCYRLDLTWIFLDFLINFRVQELPGISQEHCGWGVMLKTRPF